MTVTLTADVTCTQIDVADGARLIIHLNGHNLNASLEIVGGAEVSISNDGGGSGANATFGSATKDIGVMEGSLLVGGSLTRVQALTLSAGAEGTTGALWVTLGATVAATVIELGHSGGADVTIDNGGSLNGNVSCGSVTIRGDGDINGNVTSYGVNCPWFVPGTEEDPLAHLRIHGNLTLDYGMQFTTYFDASLNSNALIVTGTATLGGPLIVDGEGGPSCMVEGEYIPVIVANSVSGGFTGLEASIVQNIPEWDQWNVEKVAATLDVYHPEEYTVGSGSQCAIVLDIVSGGC